MTWTNKGTFVQPHLQGSNAQGHVWFFPLGKLLQEELSAELQGKFSRCESFSASHTGEKVQFYSTSGKGMQRMCRKHSPHQIGGKLSHECLKHCTLENWWEWFGVMRLFQSNCLFFPFLNFFLLYLRWGSFFSALYAMLVTHKKATRLGKQEKKCAYIYILSLAPLRNHSPNHARGLHWRAPSRLSDGRLVFSHLQKIFIQKQANKQTTQQPFFP